MHLDVIFKGYLPRGVNNICYSYFILENSEMENLALQRDWFSSHTVFFPDQSIRGPESGPYSFSWGNTRASLD